MAGLSNEQQENVWALWAKGESIRLIARTIGVSQTPVRTLLRRHGGVKPPPRARNRRHLSLSEREEISRGLAAGLSCRVIAARLGRHHTSISREVARHGGPGTYRAASADAGAWRNARRPKPSRLHRDTALSSLVAAKLERGWSPTQIAHWLRREQQDSLSHESIYHALYTGQIRAPRQGSLLRSGQSLRHARVAKPRQRRGVLRNMASIHDRPASVEDRAEVGHWEGDLIMGRRPSAVATLVERSTRLVRVVALPDGYKADAVRDALIENLADVPPQFRRSLTWDRGREMAFHDQVTHALGMQVFFCDARSPWQRGTNENTNRLLRQYLAKNADLRSFTQTDLDTIATRINERPRKVLGWASSHDAFTDSLNTINGALTG